MPDKALVGVSRCLLGHAVRYDGDSKANQIVIERLGALFELVAVCPEVEAGLSIPRPPVQLTGSIQDPSVTGRDDPDLDITGQMRAYCDSRPAGLSDLCGFVFKSRSPSCGLDSTPVFINSDCVTETSRGVFARAITSAFPQLPVIEETELESAPRYERFVDEVFDYLRAAGELRGTG
jgi:uncharacterized protein YbbK (DUF523 family)